MFVKFGDKTKKLNVKKGKRNGDQDTSNLYTEDEGDRRAEALRKSLDEQKDKEESGT